ncbi:hypothetical protein ACIBHX_15310 [Nonomuraea sp. NPDC050536]|uniref:hypothetical protein n=1 Tax=Nonomuraea sp. NPDC050536 TaxID=3364366 RepID=UPI0037C94DE8
MERAFPHKRRAAVVVALSAAVLAAGGAATAMATARGPGGPAAGNTPAPVESTNGPTPAPDSTSDPADHLPPEPAPTSEPSLGPIPKITDRNPLPMPLDSVMTSLSDIKLIETAGGLKARDCMRSLGFAHWTPESVASPADDKDSDVLDYLAPSDVAQSGYPSIFINKSGQASLKKSASQSDPSPDALRAYLGTESRTAAGAAVPEGGCESKGDSDVRGDALDLPVDPRLLAGEAKFAALRDQRMMKIFATWSSCMERRGLHYDDPLSAQVDPRWGTRTAGTPASADEKSTAAADAACQQEVNLVGTYKALEIAYQQQLLGTYRSQLTTALSIFGTWVSNAKSVIAKG